MRTFAQKQNQPQKPVSSSLARPNLATHGPTHREHPLLHLQRTIGNQAVLRLLQTNAEELKAGLTGTASPSFEHDFSRIPVHAPVPITMQPKLAVSTPGDIYEQEADHISEQVMRMPQPKLQRACACGGGCPGCQTEQPSQEHQRLQTKHVGAGDPGHAEAPPIVHEVLRSPGQPLDTTTRAFMEPRFGHDFSRVRVHSESAAEQSARDVNARAYTVGQNIVFGPGSFAPGTHEGRRLIAHELTHVVQQNGGTVSRPSPGQGELHLSKSPLASTPPAPTHVSHRPVLQCFPTYRGGSATKNNLTPKEKDLATGLSTFEDPEKAIGDNDKAAKIETDKLLPELEAVRDPKDEDTHVSIRPPNDEKRAKLLAWFDAGVESTLTKRVADAVIDIWRPKDKGKLKSK
jgi:hypothetical protein